MDRISTLPDEILGHILSFLPTKQAVSTSLLSKRWRNVFHLVSSLDFDFDNDFRRNKRKKFMDYVESFFRLQGKSPIKKFALKTHRSGLNPTCVQNWICNVLQRGVEDLNLFCGRKNSLALIFKNNTLVKLRLDGGIKITLSQDVYLPKLRTLCLHSVGFDGVHNDVFETLLPRCPVLEELVVVNDQPWVKGHSSVSSRSLKKLTIASYRNHTISLDVPNLVYLQLSCYVEVKCVNVNLDSLVEARLYPFVRINQLQKLKRGSADLVPPDTIDIIIRIRNVRVLQLTNRALEMFYYSGQELPKFDNLVRLCISSDMMDGWQILPLLIKNSPNLETLIFLSLDHYETINCGDVCVCYGEKSSSCLSSCRVKVLEIWLYRETLKHVNQVKHFLKNLPCLELMKINSLYKVMPIYLIKDMGLQRKFRRAESNEAEAFLKEVSSYHVLSW